MYGYGTQEIPAILAGSALKRPEHAKSYQNSWRTEKQLSQRLSQPCSRSGAEEPKPVTSAQATDGPSDGKRTGGLRGGGSREAGKGEGSERAYDEHRHPMALR
jgi:hypothetical protein